MAAALEGVVTDDPNTRVRFECTGQEGAGSTVCKPWPNAVTELQGQQGCFSDLPFLGKELQPGAASVKSELSTGSASWPLPQALVRTLVRT